MQLKGDYSFEIYHIAKQFEGLGKTDVPLSDLKENLAVPSSYHDLSNLKKRVLEPSCEEISKNTDINLSYETVKRGRSVIAIRFIIKNKVEPSERQKTTEGAGNKDPNTPDLFTNLTPLEINLYAKKLVHDSDFASNHILICADYVFAYDHAPEMREWLRDNTPGAVWTGMIIEFKTEQDMVLFLLRWLS